MNKRTLYTGATTGFITGIPLIGLLYIVSSFFKLPFIPYDLFDLFSRILPGQIIATGITIMVKFIRVFHIGATDSTAKLIEHIMALGLFLLITTSTGLILGSILRATHGKKWLSGLLISTGLTLFFFFVLIANLHKPSLSELLLLWLLLTCWTLVLSNVIIKFTTTLDRSLNESGNHKPKYLPFVRKLSITSIIITVILVGLGQVHSPIKKNTGADQPVSSIRQDTKSQEIINSTLLPEKRTKITPAPGTRSEITPLEKFYRIDIDQGPPDINIKTWRLKISGLFKEAVSLSIYDLMKYPEITQPATLCCISNPVGGDLISTGFFTGIRLGDLLKGLGIHPEAHALNVKAVDGYFETIEQEDMFDPRTLLVYGLNGRTLSAEQGFPLRIFIADRYGMKQPKWITQIEAVVKPEDGYWVKRGWSREARPQTLSIIDNIAKNAVFDNKIPIGGIAWASDRGVSKVEIQIDQNPWIPVQLLNPPIGQLTWVLWRYDWPIVKGHHSFSVRAIDGSGSIQTVQSSPPDPSGATGYHTVSDNF